MRCSMFSLGERWRLVLLLAMTVAALGAGQARAAFSGANGKIVFQSNRDAGNLEIYAMNPDGTSRVDLTRNPANDFQPRWSPDGSRIAFVSNRAGGDDIYTMNADGSDVRQVTTTDSTDRRPAWTSDGYIVFARGFFGTRTIDVVNPDGTGLTQLTTPAAGDSAYPAPAPRGGRIAFSRFAGETQSLYVMNAKGGAVQPITQPAPGYSDLEANWSPRGNVLVFVQFDPSGGSELYLVSTDGTGLQQLTATPDRVELEPAWSPDGRQIVFHGCAGNGNTQHCALYVINADGTGEQEISTPRTPYLDTFSSDRIDPFWGIPLVTGTGPTIGIVNGRLEVDVPSTTANDPGLGFAAGLAAAVCTLNGDFDIQVDYQLLQWPPANGIDVNFTTFDIVNGHYGNPYGLTLFDVGFGTQLAADFAGSFTTILSAPEASGSLRLVKVGETLTGYRLTNGIWTAVASTINTATQMAVSLQVFSNAPPLSHPDVQLAYDNFQVNSGTFSCPTWWDDGAPDWQSH